jgi:Transposase domain (DUF772)
MHMVGYFEEIDSERGIEWRCADSLSLREFLRLQTNGAAPGLGTARPTASGQGPANSANEDARDIGLPRKIEGNGTGC